MRMKKMVKEERNDKKEEKFYINKIYIRITIN